MGGGAGAGVQEKRSRDVSLDKIGRSVFLYQLHLE